MNWKRASEITEPGAYWMIDYDLGQTEPEEVVNVSRVGKFLWNPTVLPDLKSASSGFLKNWSNNIYLYGPIEPPGEML